MAFCTKCGTKVDGRFCPNCGYDVGGNMTTTQEDATLPTSTPAPVTAPTSTPVTTSSGATTKEILGQLYALRAGISYIACEADKYKAEQHEKEKEKEKALAAINAYGITPRPSADELTSEIDALHAKLEENNETLEKLRKTDDNLLKILLWAIAIGGGVSLILSWLFGLIFGFVCGVLVFAAGLIIGLLGFVIPLTGTMVSNIPYSRCLNKIKSIKEKCETLTTLLSHAESIESFEAEHSEFAGKEGAEKFITILEEELSFINKAWQNRSRSLLAELASAFTPTIDLRDWENLDLVIFYMETGRADTIKEALQQVDRQRQNNAIIDAIGLATKQISATISNGMLALGMTVMGCSMLLMNMVKEAKTTLSAAASLYAPDTTSAVPMLDGASEDEIASAMESKADVSSRDLMSDISAENPAL